MNNKIARLKAMLIQNYGSSTQLLTGMNCRATSVAKKNPK